MFSHAVSIVARLFSLLLVSTTMYSDPQGSTPHTNTFQQSHVPILMYHYISINPRWPADPIRTNLSVAPAIFAAQLAKLQHAGYTTITLDDFVAARNGQMLLPAKPVILTFDDGYEDFYTHAYPLLQRYGDKAIIYIISSKIDTPGYLTQSELRELAASPLITVGAHTRTHPDLPGLTVQRSWGEIAGSKQDLETLLGIRVHHFAYPSGHYNMVTLTQMRKIGFTTAVTTHSGAAALTEPLLTLHRVRIRGDFPLSSFLDVVAGTFQQSVRKPTTQPRTAGHAVS